MNSNLLKLFLIVKVTVALWRVSLGFTVSREMILEKTRMNLGLAQFGTGAGQGCLESDISSCIFAIICKILEKVFR